ncbi:MAG: lipoate--protein ligase family protein [Gemmatimonadaceae bacterium]
MRWHFLANAPADGFFNMALDEALMRRSERTGDAVFRVYGWSAPTLSLGRNQRARGCYDEAAAERLGIAFVRRPTGGRALLHDHEITYSATMPLAERAEAGAAYEFVNDVLLGALSNLGVRAERARETASVPPGPRPCFDVPAEREIVVDRRKLVGSAQWRRGQALLQHGSILIRDDQGVIARIARGPLSAPPAAATLAEALGRDPSLEEFATVLRASLEHRTGCRPVPLPDDALLDHDTSQLRSAYADESWTWRR